MLDTLALYRCPEQVSGSEQFLILWCERGPGLGPGPGPGLGPGSGPGAGLGPGPGPGLGPGSGSGPLTAY